jgi:hypothetical protein
LHPILQWEISMSEHRRKDEEAALTTAASASSPTAPLPWWLQTVVILGALLMAAGGIIALVKPAMLVSSGEQITQPTRVYAGYMGSRNLALSAMLLIMLGIRARGVLRSLMALTAFIQLLDAGMDVVEGRWAIVPGVVVYAVIFFIGAAWLSGQRFWNAAAWRGNY